jgi:hypothetical protein
VYLLRYGAKITGGRGRSDDRQRSRQMIEERVDQFGDKIRSQVLFQLVQ